MQTLMQGSDYLLHAVTLSLEGVSVSVDNRVVLLHRA